MNARDVVNAVYAQIDRWKLADKPPSLDAQLDGLCAAFVGLGQVTGQTAAAMRGRFEDLLSHSGIPAAPVSAKVSN